MNPVSVQDKVIIITGGSGVLGGSMAKHLAAQGAKVNIWGRNQERLEETRLAAAECGEVESQTVDVLDEVSVEQATAAVIAAWGHIDGLINCAGGNMPGATVGPDQSIFDVSFSDMRKVLDLNLMGSVIPTMAVGKYMTESESGSGSIVNISSMAASQALTRVLGYSIAKSGIDNFTRWMATELAKRGNPGIRVNAIAPGFFVTHQNRHLLMQEDGTPTARGQQVINKTPMGRFGAPEELNTMVQYLLSEASSFVTGTITPIDGGFSGFSGV